MPTFDEQEGIRILTDHEEKARTHPHLSHVLTREENARGGHAGKGIPRHSPEVYSALGRHRAKLRWDKARMKAG